MLVKTMLVKVHHRILECILLVIYTFRRSIEFNYPSQPPPHSMYVYTSAAPRQVLNELCGPPVG